MLTIFYRPSSVYCTPQPLLHSNTRDSINDHYRTASKYTRNVTRIVMKSKSNSRLINYCYYYYYYYDRNGFDALTSIIFINFYS